MFDANGNGARGEDAASSNLETDGCEDSRGEAKAGGRSPNAVDAVHPAVDFLQKLRPEGPWDLLAFPGEGGSPTCKRFDAAQADEAAKWVDAFVKKQHNLYYQLNPNTAPNAKAKKADITAVEYLHADLDPRDGEDWGEEQTRMLNALHYERPSGLKAPTFINATGNGFQALWKLDQPIKLDGTEAAAEAVERYTRWIEGQVGGDNTHDVSRILRLPGTINYPNAKKRAKGRVQRETSMLRHDPENTYPIVVFGKAAPKNAPTAAGGTTVARVCVDAEKVPRFSGMDVEPLRALGASDRALERLVNGYDPDRYDSPEAAEGRDKSDDTMFIACQLVRDGLADEDIAGVLANPDWPGNAHIHKPGGDSSLKYIERQIQRARERVGGLDEESSPAEVVVPDDGILLNDFRTHLVVEQIAGVLNRLGTLYRRGAEIVRERRLAEPEELRDKNGTKIGYRHAGVVELAPCGPDALMMELSRSGVPLYRTFLKGPREVPAFDALPICRTMANLADQMPFPRLTGVSTTPTLRRDEPGYDPATGLLLTYPDDMFPAVSMSPSREEAQAALDALFEPFRLFPYVGPGDRSVVISAILTGIVCGEIGPCPAHGFTAPAAGTGKTLISSGVSLIVTGAEPTAVIYTPDEEEMEKRLGACLRAGDQVIMLDNITDVVGGKLICSMISGRSVTVRVLGKSEKQEMPSRALVLANGNNLRWRHDMGRRQVTCLIDAKHEAPEQRKFDFQPLDLIRKDRPKFVAAALTILRAYIAAGKPGIDALPPLGGFEDYALVRGALVWLGWPDPVDTTSRGKAEDPEAEMCADVFRILLSDLSWRGKDVGAEFMVSELGQRAEADMTKLLGKPPTRQQWGALLTKFSGRLLMGVTLSFRRDRSKRTFWRFEVSPEARAERWWDDIFVGHGPGDPDDQGIY